MIGNLTFEGGRVLTLANLGVVILTKDLLGVFLGTLVFFQGRWAPCPKMFSPFYLTGVRATGSRLV